MVDFSRVRNLFTEAGKLPPEEREAFLKGACGGDDELRAEVRSLLEAWREDDDLLDPPSGDAVQALLGTAGAPLDDGSRVGPFRLVRLLASGGMGVVYEAEQENPRRRVALKVMRSGLGGDSSARRFRREAEILASLHHPSIATIHATGVHTDGERDVPWLAMELLEDARSIVQYAEEHELGLRERIQLFGEVCEAVHFGHMRGVIHRDLKPDNILVDRGGRAKVIDFGVARATGAELALSTLQTEAGAIVGTLATMSPEQVGGEREALDLRTDVYSLGVVLYRLLTGALPHDLAGSSLPEAARAIREDAPARPGLLDTRLRGDLETIVLTALEKEPARRYASAAALWEDLQRYLRGEAVLARPPSLTYQLRLFTRRHRAMSVAALAIFVVSIAAALVSLRFGFEAQRSAVESERRFGIVRDVGRDLLYDVLAELEGIEGSTGARATIAATATRYLDAVAAEAGDDRELLEDLVTGYERLGRFQADPDAESLGEIENGLASYARALEIARALLEENPERDDLARSALRMELEAGSLSARVGETDEADTRYAAVLGSAEARGFGEIAAAAHVHLGGRCEARGEDERARAHYETARGLYGSLDDQQENLANVDHRLGALARKAQAFDAAEQHLGAAAEHLGSELDEIDALCQRAALEEGRGNAEASAEHARAAVELARTVAARDVNDAVARARLAHALDLAGVAQRLLRDFESARASFAESAELYEANLELDPANLHVRAQAAELRVKEAGALLPQGLVAEARELSGAAVEELEAVLVRDPAALERERPLCLALDIHAQSLIDEDPARATRVLERFLEVALRYADRAPADAFAQRQVLLVHDRLGGAHRRIGEDESQPAQTRIEALERAAAAYEDCLGTFDVLRERGFLYPGDLQAAPHVEESLLACDELRARLRVGASD